MKLLTPERWLRALQVAVDADTAFTITNPVGTGQVLIINGVIITQAVETQPAADAQESGTVVLTLTTDVNAAAILAFGEMDGQDAQEGNNLAVAHLDYAWQYALTTSGAAMYGIQKAVYDWRGLPFTHRPMSNVDMQMLIDQVGVDLTADYSFDIMYQIAELEESDLKFLPVGARIVRGQQIPPEGVFGPAGRIA